MQFWRFSKGTRTLTFWTWGVATMNAWTEWRIPLQAFADQGIDLTNVDRIAIGFGTKGNMTTPGGLGKMFFDDIRLYRPHLESEPEPEP